MRGIQTSKFRWLKRTKLISILIHKWPTSPTYLWKMINPQVKPRMQLDPVKYQGLKIYYKRTKILQSQMTEIRRSKPIMIHLTSYISISMKNL